MDEKKIELHPSVRWTVIDESMACKRNAYLTLCKCVCGKKSLITRTLLVTGKSRTCGCQGIFVGAVFGVFRLISIRRPIKGRSGYGIYECNHGKKFESRITASGPRASYCECERPALHANANLKHGESPQNIRTNEYNIWRHMRQRCNYPGAPHYKNYGGRGIKVCDRWSEFSNFLKDMGRRPPNTSIDRIDNNKGYSPENCRWATKETQSRNRRNIPSFEFDGRSMSMAAWAEHFEIKRTLLWCKVSNANHDYRKVFSSLEAREKKKATGR